MTCQPKMHWIVAGRHRHAQMVAESFDWRPREWRYVNEASYLHGAGSHDHDIYVYAATYREHPKVSEIMHRVNELQFTRDWDVHWVEEAELRVNRRPARPSPWLAARPSFGTSFGTVELREMVIPAHQVPGFRIAEQQPGTVTIISVEPLNPNDRNGNWMVRFQERRSR